MTSPRPRSIVGRAVVFALFYGSIAFLGLTILVSVVQSIFGAPPPASQGPATLSAKEHAWCLRSLVGLRDELSAQITLETRHPRKEGAPLARWERWRGGWQPKLEEAWQRCAHSDHHTMSLAFQDLKRLYETYDASIRQMLGPGSELQQRLDSHIGELRRKPGSLPD